VYALGAILYEMLTGRPPFDGESVAETERQVITEEPVPPSRRNRQVPRDLETICLKCLQKTPSQRYASAQELFEDLCRFLEGKSIRARPSGVAARALKWARRRPAAALLLATLLLTAGAMAGAGAWYQAAKSQRETQARAAITAALARADEHGREEQWREAALVLTEALAHTANANSPPLEERLRQARADITLATALESARESLPFLHNGAIDYQKRSAQYRETFEDAGLQIGADRQSVLNYIGASSIRAQLIAAIDDWAVVAFQLKDEALMERLLWIATAADPDSRWRNRARDPVVWRDREQLAQLAREAFVTSPPPPGYQLALLGMLLWMGGDSDQGAQLLGEACRRQPTNFWVNREMGALMLQRARYPEAAGYFRAARALRPDNAWVHQHLGRALLNSGDIDGGLAAHRRAVALDPNSLMARCWLVNALGRAGYWAEARAECRRTLDLNPADSCPIQMLGNAQSESRRDEEAMATFRWAIDLEPNRELSYTLLGWVLERNGRHEEIVTAFRQRMKLDPADGYTRLGLAKALVAAGRPAEAVAYFETALPLIRAASANYNSFGDCLRSLGRPGEAALSFQKALKLNPRDTASWKGLAAARLDQGRFAEAREPTQRALAPPANAAARRAQQRQLDLCDTLLSIADDLPRILDGKERPTLLTTQLALAEWCYEHKRLPGTALGYYQAVLHAQPSVAADPETGYRFHAACAAARVLDGTAKDAVALDDPGRARLRQQTLGWLTAEVDAWAERHRRGLPGERTLAATAVRSWPQTQALAVVRDTQGLAQLPAEERRAWDALWHKVKGLAARDPVALIASARAHVARCEWQQAAADYSQGLALEEPTDRGEVWFEYAAAQLLAGDRSGYRQSCAQMVSRCEKGSVRQYYCARACTLAPESTAEPRLAEQLTEQELRDFKATFWASTELGALAVRAGRCDPAIPYLKASLDADGRPGRAVLNWLWLALAHQKLGKDQAARQWLDKAADWLDQQEGLMSQDTPVLGLHRHNWLEAHVLRQEAKGRIH
jgi:serine/threonine-protein kinase